MLVDLYGAWSLSLDLSSLVRRGRQNHLFIQKLGGMRKNDLQLYLVGRSMGLYTLSYSSAFMGMCSFLMHTVEVVLSLKNYLSLVLSYRFASFNDARPGYGAKYYLVLS